MQALSLFNFFYGNSLNSRKINNDSHQEVVTKLKFISLIKKDEKINVNTLSVYNKNIMTSILRRFYHENRDDTLFFINSTVLRSFEILKLTSLSTSTCDQEFTLNLIKDLIRTIEGLQNIQTTYCDDRMFYCNIQMVIENITTKLHEFSPQIPDI